MTVQYVLSRAGQEPLPVRLHVQAMRVFATVGVDVVVVARRRPIHRGGRALAWFVSRGEQDEDDAVRIARKPDAVEYVVAEVARRLGGVIQKVRKPHRPRV